MDNAGLKNSMQSPYWSFTWRVWKMDSEVAEECCILNDYLVIDQWPYTPQWERVMALVIKILTNMEWKQFNVYEYQRIHTSCTRIEYLYGISSHIHRQCKSIMHVISILILTYASPIVTLYYSHTIQSLSLHHPMPPGYFNYLSSTHVGLILMHSKWSLFIHIVTWPLIQQTPGIYFYNLLTPTQPR